MWIVAPFPCANDPWKEIIRLQANAQKKFKVALMDICFLDILCISSTLGWIELSSAVKDKWLLSIFKFPMENYHS